MKLLELIAAGQLIEVQCPQCRARTPLDPDFFFVRRGDIDLKLLGEHLCCAQCGSPEVKLSAKGPSEPTSASADMAVHRRPHS